MMLRRIHRIASWTVHGPNGPLSRPLKFKNQALTTCLYESCHSYRVIKCHALSTMSDNSARCELISVEKLSELLLQGITRTIDENRNCLENFDEAIIEAGEDEKVLSNIKLPKRRATIIFSDVDGTLKVSHGTNAENLIGFELRRAILSINGVDGCIFFIPATGRDIQLVDSVFPGMKLATIADDGGYIRYPSGRSVSYPLPPIDEFRRLGDDIINRGQAKEIKLANAYGLSYSEMSSYFPADVESFRALALERRDITVYTHKYPGSQEIIVQDGRHTKGTAVHDIVRDFKNNGFDHVHVVSAGDSSNDESHFRAVNQLGGFSVRIKYKQDTAAKYYVPSLEVWQNAIIRTSRQLIRMGIANNDVFEDIADKEADIAEHGAVIDSLSDVDDSASPSPESR